MDFIMGSRQSGKTARMIAWMHENPGSILLCHSERERVRLGTEYPELRQRIKVWGGSLHRFSLRGDVKYALDNLDLFLQAKLGILPDILSAPSSRIVMCDNTLPWVPKMTREEASTGDARQTDGTVTPGQPFNERSLEEAIYATWGQHGAHADVFRALRRDAARLPVIMLVQEQLDQHLVREAQLLAENNRLLAENEAIKQRLEELEPRLLGLIDALHDVRNDGD